MAEQTRAQRQGEGLTAKLYLITDRQQTTGRKLIDVVASALSGGARLVQLREKDLDPKQLYPLAAELRNLTRDSGAKLIINRDIELCLAVEADGVHLGRYGISIREARRRLGRDRLIGYSAHAVDEALQAECDGADFITFSPVFHTPSKAGYGPPVGLDKLTETCKRISIPVFALGGINTANIPEVMACGASGVALISAVISAPSPQAASAALLETIEKYALHR